MKRVYNDENQKPKKVAKVENNEIWDIDSEIEKEFDFSFDFNNLSNNLKDNLNNINKNDSISLPLIENIESKFNSKLNSKLMVDCKDENTFFKKETTIDEKDDSLLFSPNLFPPLNIPETNFVTEQNDQDIFQNMEIMGINEENFDIKYPENQISVTSIINGIECVRKSNIMEYFSTGSGAKNKYFIVGSLVHRIFQFRLYQLSSTYSTDIKNKLNTKDDLHKLVLHIIKTSEYMIDMYVGNIDENEIISEIETYYDAIIKWSDILLGKQKLSIDLENELMASKSSICDIEEVISSKKYGIKGNIDVTCLIDSNKSLNKKHILPVELKSSRSYGKYGRSEHRAQLLLYQLVLSEIYNQKIENGLLLYLRDVGNAIKVKFIQQEAIHLFNIRNYIASYPFDQQLGDFALQNTCNRCEFKSSCKLIATCDKQIIPEHLKNIAINTEDISLSYLNFFNLWRKIIHQLLIEEMKQSCNDTNKDCSLLLFPYKLKVLSCNSLDLGKKYTFKCKIIKTFSFESQKLQLSKNEKILKTFIVGDYVILKSLGTFSNTWKCNIQQIDTNFIILGSFRPLPIHQFGKNFCLEKMPHSINFKTENQILLNFILNDSNHVENLRKLLILNHSPSFNDITNEIKLEIQSFTKNLNNDQVNAIEKCLKANSYSLIWGLPGTGKTTTIASLIHILSRSNKKVLIVSNTNNSVDNILLKLLQKRIDFLRVGPINRVNEKLESFVLSNIVNGHSLESFQNMIEKKLIIATTCSSLSNNIFLKINWFDYCIIDESTQILLINLLPALIMSQKFILVGDHKQLPPIVTSNHPIMNEAKISIFEKLFLNHPQAVSALTIQYRMPDDIANICSNVFYNGAMTSSENNNSDLIIWQKNFENLKNKYIFDGILFFNSYFI